MVCTQTAIYHKFYFDKRSSTWVLISASTAAEASLDRYIKKSGILAESSPLEIHLILLDAALANWRPYIVYLTEQVIDMVWKHSRSSQIRGFTHIRISQTKYS